jgi:hypothetical protein
MLLSWNEIRCLAITFSKEWTGARREQAEKQTFWNEFFQNCGIRRRSQKNIVDDGQLEA